MREPRPETQWSRKAAFFGVYKGLSSLTLPRSALAAVLGSGCWWEVVQAELGRLAPLPLPQAASYPGRSL